MRKFLIAALGLAALTTSAAAADLPVKAARPMAVTAAVPFSWTGWYIGANIGGAWGAGSSASATPGAFDETPLISIDTKGSGVFGGLQLGYNWQFAPAWVAGIEAEGGYIGIDKDRTVTGAVDQNFVSVKYEGYGTLAGRLGWTNGPLLAYGKGGLAVARIRNQAADIDGTAIDPTDFTSTTNTAWGYAVGGGLEWAFASNWTAKVEYLYMDFGSERSTNLDGDFFKHENKLQTVKFGVNYKFGG
jgi:outer membrane immunogenic protein